MQLRIPKKYQPRRRRRHLISRRFMSLVLAAGMLSLLAYAIMQNPTPYREKIKGVGEDVVNQVKNARAEMFPVQPTPTPDVRQELVGCDNAYLVGDLEEVIKTCSAALKGLPNDVNLHYRVAYAMVITSSGGGNTLRINAALDMAKQTIAASPESPLGWAVQAMALDFSRQHNLALGSVLRALELDPDLTIAKAHLANIYRNLGRPELATNAIESALIDLQSRGGDNETQAQVYRNYARLLLSQGNYDGALDYYQRARQTMPSQVYISIEMAEIYTILGNSDPSQKQKAIDLLQETLAIAPRDTALLYLLGANYYGQGDVPRAVDLFTRCVDANPDSIDCLSRLGWINYHSQNADNYPIAIQYLSRATELGSTEPYDWFLLGRAYFRLGQCSSATTPLRQGYRLRQQEESSYVTLEDFNTAFRECNITP
jgi:tetratricopeptide (TPR) repeat protein